MNAQRFVRVMDRTISELRRASRALLVVLLAFVGVILPAARASAATPPDPPTIGTATSGVASATVSFTAPGNDGGSPITGYSATCTSSNGGGAGATSGASSPISVGPLTNGATYTCTVTATNGVGTSAPSSASNTVVPATTPDPPTIGTATPGVGSISVAFTAPVDNGGSAITGYTASCVSSTGGVTGSAAGASSPIVVSALTKSATYTCSVAATNAAGTGGPSAASNAVVVSPSAPGAPSIGAVTAGNASVSVAFTPPADDGGSPITSYEATCLSSTGGAADIEDGPSSPILVGPLTNGATYTCSVTATNAVGTSPDSGSSSTFVPASVPGTPVIGTATAALQSATVSFSAPADDGGSAITGYTATCVSSTGGATGSASGGASPIVVSPLTNGAQYQCFVTATNAVGTSGPSAASNTVVPAITVPDPPTIGTATSGNASINVAFTPAANSGGSPITSFDATCTSSDGGAPGTGTGSESPVVVSGVTNGNTYTCTITATNGVGTSLPSSASNAVVPMGPPDSPTLDSATSGVASISVAFEPPGSNGGSAVTSYTAACTSSDGGAPGTTSGASSPISVGPLTNGHTYTCTVLATNAIGASSPSSPSDPVVPATVPNAPVIGTASSAVNAVVVHFTPPADNGGSAIISYTARCVPVGGGTVATNTKPDPANGFVGVPVVAGKTYTCSVTATNAVGRSGASAASNPISAATVPGAPVIGTASPGNASVSVAFSPPGNNGGLSITSYHASCTSSNGGVAGSASGAASPIVVGSLTTGKTYTCTVTATNPVGTGPASAASNAVVPAPTAPGAPVIGTASAGNASVSVAFSPPGSNGGSAITGYNAGCTSSDGGVPGSGAGASSPIVVGSLTNGKTYTCTVTATNIAGTGPASAASNAVVPAPTAPGAPAIGSATRGNASVSVAFGPPGSDGGSAITSYQASCTSSNGGIAGSASGASSPIVVASLTNGKTYTCKVTATNAIGTGPASAASNTVIPSTVPGTPTIGTATPGNGAASVTFTAPATNGGAAITSYTATCVSSNGGATGSASAAASPIVVGSLTNGKTYTCSVTATNVAGTGGASGASNAVIAGTPTAPTAVTATAGAGKATVSWTTPSTANGSAITGYTITAFVGFFQVAQQTFNSPVTTETFTGLTAGTTYTFHVAAINARGTGPFSTASNAVTPT